MFQVKSYISVLLLLVSVCYSINLHGLSHTFEDDHSEDSNPCELCIINHQKDKAEFAIQPNFVDYTLNAVVFVEQISEISVSQQPSVTSNYFSGQLFNRPPPFTL